MTGAFVNKTLFEQAKVPIPGAKATWDDWMEATRKVAAATKTPYAMAMDRSGHRFAPLAVAMGAKIFDANGVPVIDDGYQAAARKFLDWNRQRPDAEGGLGRHRRLVVSRCVRGVRERPRRAVLLGKLAGEAHGHAGHQVVRLDGRACAVRSRRAAPRCPEAPRSSR